MDQEHLRTLLEQLQAELSQNTALDDHSRQLLLNAQEDIRRAVEQPANGEAPALPADQQPTQNRLQAAMVALEASHPQLASALEKGMVALSNLGF